MSLDSRLLPRVRALLAKYGKQATLSRHPSSSYAPGTGHTTPGSPDAQPVRLCPPDSYARLYVPEDVRRSGKLLTFVAGLGLTFAPERGQYVLWDGIDLRVTEVEPLFAQLEIALYGLWLEGDGAIVASSSATRLDRRLVPTAKRLVNKYGKQVTFYEKSGYAYSPGTGAATETPVQHVTKVTPPDEYEERFIDGDVIRRGDLRAFAAGQNLGFQPERGWTLRLDYEGTYWKVVEILPVYSGEQIALWEVQLRR